MDRPAMVAATVVGVVLIAVSAPFLGSIGDSAATDYAISWTEAEAGSSQAATGAAGSTTTVRVLVSDALPSNATVAVESCSDGAQPPLTQAATVAWTLFEGDEEKASGTFTCAGDDSERVAQEDRPDVGTVSASSPSEAERQAYAAGDNETVEYRLEFSWSRPGGPAPLPLPVPSPAFSATLSLAIEEWTATANEADQEAPR